MLLILSFNNLSSTINSIFQAFIIAFTSNFIPRLVYRITISDKYSLEGFLDHSLSKFDTRDLKSGTQPNITLDKVPVEICRYPDYREPPDSPNKYEYTVMFWNILAARLAFIVVFEVRFFLFTHNQMYTNFKNICICLCRFIYFRIAN